MALKIEPDTLSHWIKKNKIGFDISEIVFVNWNAGGTSSIGLLKENLIAYTAKNYKLDK
jgi:myo-inositol-1-phosphate synthase